MNSTVCSPKLNAALVSTVHFLICKPLDTCPLSVLLKAITPVLQILYITTSTNTEQLTLHS